LCPAPGVLVPAGVGKSESVATQEKPPARIKLHGAPATGATSPHARTDKIGPLAVEVAWEAHETHALLNAHDLAADTQTAGRTQSFMIGEDAYVFVAPGEEDNGREAGRRRTSRPSTFTSIAGQLSTVRRPPHLGLPDPIPPIGEFPPFVEIVWKFAIFSRNLAIDFP
jgi:hypothetical protein